MNPLKKINSKTAIFLFGFFLVFLLFLPANSASALTCAVRAGACNAGETPLLRMLATNNSHAGFVGSSAYTNLICCSEAGVTIGTNCAGNFDTFLKLSAADNAHVEKNTFLNYTNNACISFDVGAVSCFYQNGACATGACLASISADTNAHIGDCAAYSEKVCCGPGIAVCVTDGLCDNNCPASCTAADDPDCAAGGCCGDGTCDAGETNAICPRDCPATCSPDGCNGICPAGCTVAQDPDCGCLGGNGCCAPSCTNATDGDCPIVPPPPPPPPVCTTGGLVPCGRNCDDPGTVGWDESKSCTLCHFIILADNVINFLMKVVAIVAMLALVIGGLIYTKSSGNKSLMSSAKQNFSKILYGFVIVFIAWVTVSVAMTLFGFTDPSGDGNWAIFTCNVS